MRSTNAPNRISQLGPGHDACLLYENELERNACFLAHMRAGLDRGDGLVLVADTSAAELLLADLDRSELPVDALRDDDRLVVVEAAQAELEGIDVSDLALVDALEEAAERAGAGTRMVRVAADLTWAAVARLDSATVERYQAHLGRFIADRQAACLCAFDRHRVPAVSALRLMAAHPLVVRGTELFANLFSFPAEGSEDRDRADATLRHRLETLEQHKRDLQSLRESEELYNSIVESMEDGVVVIDREFRYLYWNPAMERIFAIVNSAGGETRPGPPLHQTTRGMDAMIVKAMVGRTVHRDEIPRRLADGTVIYTNELYIPLRDIDGGIRGVVGIVRDITEQKVRSERLRRKRELVSLIMAGIPAAMVAVDRAGAVLFANPRAEDLLGVTPTDSASDAKMPAPDWPFVAVSGEPLSAGELPFNRVLSTGQPLETVSLAVRRPDDALVPVLVEASPIHDEGGAVDLVLLTCRVAASAPPERSATRKPSLGR